MEADRLEPIFEAVKVAHKSLTAKGIQWIESTLIDDRRDKPQTMKDKIDIAKNCINRSERDT